MAEIKWIKLSADMFSDRKIELIEDMPEADTIIVIWIKLLTMTGQANMGGYIMLTENIPYTEEMLLSAIKRPLPVIKMALSIFERFGMLEVSESGAYFLPNWEKHQNVDGMDKVRAQTNKRVQSFRERQKLLEPGKRKSEQKSNVTRNATGNVTVTPRNGTDIELDLEQEKDSSCCLSPEADNNSKDEGIPSSRQGSVPATPETDTDSGQVEISSDELDYRNAIANKYLQRRGKGLEISVADDLAISEMHAAGIPLSTVLDGIDKSFDNFKPKYTRHEIGSIRYCVKVIEALHDSRTLRMEQVGEEEQKPVEADVSQTDTQYTEGDLQKMLAELRAKQGG
ncbi:phage replisome organizer N-terminal domain-containing protein [Paenibacillus sp. RRE4]|uniref:phage replisome organizer N-terminal domain-containing protein n=1 Tax=Paenibacillus sp. RRE4 TaxID=2962587 RepID=UPI002882B92D|nr:phage replisome organizer N-terminal domain-containing protein [Paenibacillus sp. RRE4]MDT0123918.1 phage replisome organizer N-terminal domain-containing protein [Paenibacillus sp. RRE4]